MFPYLQMGILQTSFWDLDWDQQVYRTLAKAESFPTIFFLTNDISEINPTIFELGSTDSCLLNIYNLKASILILKKLNDI